MAMTLVPSFNTKRVFGTWVRQAGMEMRPGGYKVTVPVRLTNATDDVIIPQGVYASGQLNTEEGSPSLDIQAPCTDDPDNWPSGWKLLVEITFLDAPKELYVLDVPVTGGDINLRTVILAQTVPSQQSYLIRGVPGGVAGLDADGDVIDADGQKVIAGSGAGSGADGASAYEVAVQNGFVGTEAEWLNSLTGASAYEMAVQNGFVGTEAEWLASLTGASAYEMATQSGFVGTEAEWLASLVGPEGPEGPQGPRGPVGTAEAGMQIALDIDGVPYITGSTPTGPITLAQDFFEGEVASGWGTAAVGGTWVATVSSTSKSGGAGVMLLGAPDAAASARLPEAVATDMVGQVTVSADKLAAGSGSFYLFRARITSTEDEYRFKVNVASDGTITAWWATSIADQEVVLAGGPSRAVSFKYKPGTRMIFKFSALGSSPTRLQSKVWLDGQPEPTAWLHDFEDSASVLQKAGHVGLYARLSGGTTNTPIEFRFDDFLVTGTSVLAPPGGEDPDPGTEPGGDSSAGILQVWDLDNPSLPATNLGPKAGGASQTYSPASVFQVVQVPIDNYGDGVSVPERFQIVRGADVPGTGVAKPTSALRVELRPEDRQISGANEYNRMEAYFRHAVPGSTPPEQWPDPPGSERWFIFQVLFPEGFLFGGEGGRPHNWESLVQFKGYPDRGSPLVNVEINRREMRLGYGGTSADAFGGSIVPGLWTVLAIGQKLSPDAAVGWTRGYRDGVEVLPKEFKRTLEGAVGDPEAEYIKYGIYRSASWTVPHVVYLGGPVLTDNYADAMAVMSQMRS